MVVLNIGLRGKGVGLLVSSVGLMLVDEGTGIRVGGRGAGAKETLPLSTGTTGDVGGL